MSRFEVNTGDLLSLAAVFSELDLRARGGGWVTARFRRGRKPQP